MPSACFTKYPCATRSSNTGCQLSATNGQKYATALKPFAWSSAVAARIAAWSEPSPVGK